MGCRIGESPGPAGGGRGVVYQVLQQGTQRVGRAQLLNEAGDGEFHELLARPTKTVTGSAETRDVTIFEQSANDFVERGYILGNPNTILEILYGVRVPIDFTEELGSGPQS